jgi:nuclear transport factor 2 (NTF2) superfamily protein
MNISQSVLATQATEEFQPLTEERANATLRRAEEIWSRRDVAVIGARYHEDCVVRYAHLPEIRGKAAFLKFLEARLARMKDYKLYKKLIAFTDRQLINSFDGHWTDAETGHKVSIFAIEVTEYDEKGQIIRWQSGVSPLPGPHQLPLPLVSSSYTT